MDACVTRCEVSIWVRPCGAGAAGPACLSLSKGSQGFSTSPSLVAWFGLPHSMVAPPPHVSAPGTKATSALSLLTASKSHRASYPHSVGY